MTKFLISSFFLRKRLLSLVKKGVLKLVKNQIKKLFIIGALSLTLTSSCRTVVHAEDT